MFKSVNHVLVGNAFTTASDLKSVADGEFVMFDQNQNIIDPTAAIAATVKTITFGVVHGTIDIFDPATNALVTVPNLILGNTVRRGDAGVSIYNAHEAFVNAVASIDLSALTINPGETKDYGMRIVYKDVDSLSAQFTKTYYAENVTDAASFISKMMNTINKDMGSRVVATTAGTTLTLTAKDIKIENNIDEFSMVAMEISIYEMPKNTTIFNAPKIAPEDITWTVTEPNYGIGNYQEVLDMERKYAGYRGLIYKGAYPEILGTQYATAGVNYNEFTVNYESLYRSNDNQYVKSTPIAYTLYTTADLTALATNLNNFMYTKA